MPDAKGKWHSLLGAHLSLHCFKCSALMPHLHHPSPGLQRRWEEGALDSGRSLIPMNDKMQALQHWQRGIWKSLPLHYVESCFCASDIN